MAAAARCLETRSVVNEERVRAMSLLGSIALVVAGALLYFRIDGSWAGVEVGTFGVILILIGVIGVLVSVFFAPSRSAVAERPVDDERPTLRR
jgi:hypothetical protein